MKLYISFLSILIIFITSITLLNCQKFKPDIPTNTQTNRAILDPTLNKIYNPSGNTYNRDDSHNGGSSSGRNGNNQGTTAKITSWDTDVLEELRFGEPFNDIFDMRVHINLEKTKNDYWAGKVSILYGDTALENNSRRFNSGRQEDARYNLWFNNNLDNTDKKDCDIQLIHDDDDAKKTKDNEGKNHCFHGYFQDKDSSLILVINKFVTIPAGSENNATIFAGGSIWTMSFRATFFEENSCKNRNNPLIRHHNKKRRGDSIPFPNKKCWFLSVGPYDCRSWRASDSIKEIEPDGECYEKLGSFEKLNIAKAFNVENLERLVAD